MASLATYPTKPPSHRPPQVMRLRVFFVFHNNTAESFMTGWTEIVRTQLRSEEHTCAFCNDKVFCALDGAVNCPYCCNEIHLCKTHAEMLIVQLKAAGITHTDER